MYNNFFLALVSVIGIVFFDDDPSGVSIQEWILFAIMIYAAIGFYRRFKEYVQRNG
jgi:hypothetical protein